jgi:hypothetical protein
MVLNTVTRPKESIWETAFPNQHVCATAERSIITSKKRNGDSFIPDRVLGRGGAFRSTFLINCSLWTKSTTTIYSQVAGGGVVTASGPVCDPRSSGSGSIGFDE